MLRHQTQREEIRAMDAVIYQVLTCANPQAVQIGEGIEIAVLSVEDGRVRLGVTAPGCRLRTIDPVPLPAGTPGFDLMGFDRGMGWPKG